MKVSLRQPAPIGAFLTLHGRLEIFSLSGSFLLPLAPLGETGLTILLVESMAKLSRNVMVQYDFETSGVLDVSLF